MSDIDVEGSDDEVIVVIESPDRQTITDDIDVEAVTDEEVAIAISEASYVNKF
jgi:nitrate reductase NapAB chaperone NapD